MNPNWDGHWLKAINDLIEAEYGGYNVPTILAFDEYREWYEGDTLCFVARPKAGVVFSDTSKIVKTVDGERRNKGYKIAFKPDGRIYGEIYHYSQAEILAMIGKD